MSRVIPSIITPDIWYNLQQCKTIPPQIQLQRPVKAPTTAEGGSFVFAQPNVPIKEWIGPSFSGMRLDSASTNLFPNSNPTPVFANHYGIEQGTQDDITPFGTAVKSYREDTNVGIYNDHVLDFNGTNTDTVSSTKTYSFFIKSLVANTDRGISLRVVADTGNYACNVYFNTDNTINRLQSSVGTINPTAKAMGNGWYRIWFTIEASHKLNGIRIQIYSALYGGQWTAIDTNMRFFLADFQFDRRNVRGNPVITSTGTATAAADNAFIDIPPSKKHTLFIESYSDLNDALGASGSLLSSTDSARHLSMMIFGGNALAKRGAFVRSNTLGDLGAPFITAKGIVYRQAMSYDQDTGDIVLCHNGSINPITQKSAGLVFDRLGIGCSGGIGNQLDGYVRRIGYWNKVLVPEQLIELTR